MVQYRSKCHHSPEAMSEENDWLATQLRAREQGEIGHVMFDIHGRESSRTLVPPSVIGHDVTVTQAPSHASKTSATVKPAVYADHGGPRVANSTFENIESLDE